MVETTILKKRVLNVQFSQMLFYWLYTVTWLDILDFNVISIVCTHFYDMSCVLVYNEYFFLNGKGVQVMQGKTARGWRKYGRRHVGSCAGMVRQEQIIRTRCNLWISKDGDLMVFTLNCWSSKQHFMILTVLFLYKTCKHENVNRCRIYVKL